jgi:hypothetical protein
MRQPAGVIRITIGAPSAQTIQRVAEARAALLNALG